MTRSSTASSNVSGKQRRRRQYDNHYHNKANEEPRTDICIGTHHLPCHPLSPQMDANAQTVDVLFPLSIDVLGMASVSWQ